jgi:hypothetical protein
MENISQLITPLDKFCLFLGTLLIAYVFALSSYTILNNNHQGLLTYSRGQEALYLIAVLEGLGALLILLPRTAVLGSSLLIISTAYILATSMPLVGGLPSYPITMLGLCIVLLTTHISFHSQAYIKQKQH